MDEPKSIPDSIPRESLAYKWCQLEGRRDRMHESFRRWTPLDYDEDELNRSIDAELEKYPEALEAFPEKNKSIINDDEG